MMIFHTLNTIAELELRYRTVFAERGSA